MWFDPHAALKQLGGGDMPPPDPAPRVAQVARVARPHPSKSAEPDAMEPAAPIANLRFPDAIKTADTICDDITSDADAYLAALTLHGPMTYGAAAVALRWGATQAWQAEAVLMAEGRATMTREGRAIPVRAREFLY